MDQGISWKFSYTEMLLDTVRKNIDFLQELEEDIGRK
jgi:hypothetical protein